MKSHKIFDQSSYLMMIASILLSSLFFSCKTDPPVTPPIPPPEPTPLKLDFITGMDLSYQPLLEEVQTSFFKQNGEEVNDMLDFVADNGVNLVRVRLFHSPDQNDKVLKQGSLAKVLDYCERIKNSGNKILLDIHYSDTWADPGHQTLPKAWEGLSLQELADSVFTYTDQVLKALEARNALPYMVQIGNETNSGFLWDQGRVWGAFEGNWANYAALANNAIKAVEEMETASDTEILTMFHVAGVTNQNAFFAKLAELNIDYDVIGLSHYHVHHTQNLTQLASSLNQLADTYQKPIIIVETNYPFTLDWDDWTNNVVGLDEQLIAGYPATPEGQKAYTEKLVEILNAVPDDLGAGFVWWAPDLVAFDGDESSEGSSFENIAVFDFDHQALPVLDVFKNN